MTSIAWLLILVGIIIAQRVYKGRVNNIGEDLSDAFLALLHGDSSGLQSVLERTGDANSAAEPDLSTFGSDVGNTIQKIGQLANNALVRAAIARGSAAKGYKFGATGPDYYDCSGLMYRACQDVGYTGGRFTTFTIGTNKAFSKVTSSPVVGNIVVWPTRHMGVVVGDDLMYSAMNPKSGIGTAKISTFFSGSTPVYYTLNTDLGNPATVPTGVR